MRYYARMKIKLHKGDLPDGLDLGNWWPSTPRPWA